ncbi:MAG: DNA repair protein RecO [Nitrospiraceae bacterium]|nr:DNA repair protein RecO [Nitrospiraceae bacterium]
MSEIFKNPAFVISGRDLGESDRLITFYTMDRGKTLGIAKGAKRSRHRFVNALEPFTLLNLSLALPRTTGLNRVDSAEILDSFSPLRGKIECYIMASLCCELVDLWTREGDPQREIFELMRSYFRSLKKGFPPKKATLFFETQLLTLVGYAPNLDLCLCCKKPPDGNYVAFRIHAGGFICKKCQKRGKDTNRITLGALNSLKYIQKKTFDNLCRLSITDAAFEEAWSLIHDLHCHYLQQVPASYKVVDTIKSGIDS